MPTRKPLHVSAFTPWGERRYRLSAWLRMPLILLSGVTLMAVGSAGFVTALVHVLP